MTPRRFALAFITLSASCILLDLVTRLIVPTSFVAGNRARLFFTADYQAEYKRSNQGWEWVDNYFIPRDMTGKWIHVHDGFRVTTGQPATWTRTVWLFGNSTMFSAEVPDDETVASYLQTLMPFNTRVVNVGMGNAGIIHEVSRLKTLPLSTSDIVIFYDGQIDAESIWYSLPDICQNSQWPLLMVICEGLYDNPAWMNPRVAQVIERVQNATAKPSLTQRRLVCNLSTFYKCQDVTSPDCMHMFIQNYNI